MGGQGGGRMRELWGGQKADRSRRPTGLPVPALLRIVHPKNYIGEILTNAHWITFFFLETPVLPLSEMKQNQLHS